MNDVSEYVKVCLLDARKKLLRKSYQQKTLMERLNDFNDKKRETRNALLSQKRKLDVSIEEIENRDKKLKISTEMQKPSKRLEMLYKWKIEKEKRKQEEKEKKKPIFKVCHVGERIGLPNFKNETRIGLPNSKNETIKSGFAPPDYKFKAPKNIKPINMKLIKSTSQQSFVHEKSKEELSKTKSRHLLERNTESISHQRNTRASARNLQGSKAQQSVPNKKTSHKSNPPVIDKITAHKSNQSVTDKITAHKSNQSVTDKKTAHKSDIRNSKQQPKSTSSITTNSVSPKMGRRINTRSQTRSQIKKDSSTIVKGNKSEKVADKDVSNTKSKHTVYNSPLKIRNCGETLSNIQKNPHKQNKKSVVKKGSTLKENVERELFPVDNELSHIDKKRISTPKPKKIRDSIESLKKNTKSISPIKPASTKKPDKQPKKNTVIHSLETCDNKEYDVGMATGSASPDYPVDGTLTAEDSPFTTPVKNNQEDFPVYVSPFVTVSRGKTSARKEYHERYSAGSRTPGGKKDILDSASPRVGAEYFSRILDNEIDKIESICDIWNNYKQENKLPEEATDMINVAIGQSKLLISKKFQQFRNLIEQCKTFDFRENIITCEDLHGFWDMTYMQVEDLNKRFNNLDKLKANNWQEILPEQKPITKRSRGRHKKIAASEALKNHIKAARNMKNSNNNEDVNEIPQAAETKLFSGGYFSIKSPVENFNGLNKQPTSARRSLRISLLGQQTKRRFSSSPGLTMLKVTQAIKCGDGITPSKSILKSDITKSEKGVTKTVLFKDE